MIRTIGGAHRNETHYSAPIAEGGGSRFHTGLATRSSRLDEDLAELFSALGQVGAVGAQLLEHLGVGLSTEGEGDDVVVGGLASLVVESLFNEGISKKVTRIGLPDRYIECGAVPMLQARYGLTTETIVARIMAPKWD